MTTNDSNINLFVTEHDKLIYKSIIDKALGTKTYNENDYVIKITNSKQLARKLT